MSNYWFARHDHDSASRWAFTPISWKGYAAICGPIFLGSFTAQLILSRLPQGELGEWGPIAQIAGITLGAMVLWIGASWLLFNSRIDWKHRARDYRKGKLVADGPDTMGGP